MRFCMEIANCIFLRVAKIFSKLILIINVAFDEFRNFFSSKNTAAINEIVFKERKKMGKSYYAQIPSVGN